MTASRAGQIRVINPDEATRYKHSVVCNESVREFLKTNLDGSFS